MIYNIKIFAKNHEWKYEKLLTRAGMCVCVYVSLVIIFGISTHVIF